MSVQYSGKKMKFGSVEVSFATEIRKVIESGDLYVVEIDYQDNLQNRNNIYGVNTRGDVVWQVEDAFPHAHHWLGALVKESDGIWCESTHGHRLKIDPKTGKILERVFTK